ncbi:MAG: hypothetical protein ACRBN8_11805 [Nannocystales bacterium]
MDRPRSSLPLLAGLYTVQGAVFGFTTGVLIPALAARGVSLEEQAGILAFASLPWVLKLPVAVALDRLRPGAARVAGLSMVLLSVVLFGLAGLGPGLPWFSGLGVAWLGINLLLAAQDVSADALAIDTVSAEHRGRANGAMWGGHQVGGTLLGTVGLGMVLSVSGLGTTLACLAGFVLLGGVWAFRSNVRASVQARQEGLAGLLRSPTTWLVGGLASVFLVADVFTSALAGEFLVNRLGWGLPRVTGILPWANLGGQVVGYGIAVVGVDRLGHARATALGSALLGGLWLLFAGAEPAWVWPGFVYGFVVLQAGATALMYVGLYAWLMGHVDPRFRATHYAVFMSLLNAPRAWVPGLAAGGLAALGWSGVFALAGSVQVVLGATAWVLGRHASSAGTSEGTTDTRAEA